jgi:hypothetical protein
VPNVLVDAVDAIFENKGTFCHQTLSCVMCFDGTGQLLRIYTIKGLCMTVNAMLLYVRMF